MVKHNNGFLNYTFIAAWRSKWWIDIVDIIIDNRMSVN